MALAARSSFAISLLAVLALAGCDENGEFILASAPSDEAGTEVAEVATGEQVIERDVEAPEVFQASEAALWDGRPSLGGVWVAHPDVTEPERVLIRNGANGNEVIGALFRRERNNPGPRIQVSSDAASDLGMLAGQPVQLEVVALKREETVIAAPVETAAVAESIAPGEISAQPLDPIAAAEAAIDAAEAAPVAAAPAAAAAPASTLDKPYVQIGIFSVEANANNTAASLRNAGIVPTVRRQTSQDKEFWRVIVGPASTSQERASIEAKVKELGFTDAYFVKN
jgi:cell division septation protein DedD